MVSKGTLRAYGMRGMAIIFLACGGSARTSWLPPDDTVPVGRLIENLERQLEAKPDDHYILSQLARVHSRAYALPETMLDVSAPMPIPREEAIDPSAPWRLYEQNSVSLYQPDGDPELLTEAHLHHLREAIRYYRRASEHTDASKVDWLGLGFIMEQAARVSDRIGWVLEEDLDGEDATDVRAAYQARSLAAYQRAIEAKGSQESSIFQSVAQEASEGVVRILSRRTSLTVDEKRRLKAARRLVAEERVRGPRAVTPIILHSSERRPLSTLLAPEVHVSFDLDGTGRGEVWPWVQPDTGFLVWDGDGRRDVTSGRSLIGSVTWWLFWEHGYAVLRVLDDDGDGWLRGSELAGLAVWRDANSDGVSSPVEVSTLSAVGIVGLAVDPTGSVDGMPMNGNGAQLEDGRFLPTYDWITNSVEETP